VARHVVVGDLRVQQIERKDGRRSWTNVWPEGTVHTEADRFLRLHDGSGTQRTYAYLLVDHLRWLERECLTFAAFQLRDLCGVHERGYIRAGRPGGAKLPKNFFATYEHRDRPVPVTCEDEVAFRAWCRAQLPVPRTGTVNLRGLRPLLRAEVQWGMYVHGLQPVAVWHLTWVQSLADECQRRDVASLAGLDAWRGLSELSTSLLNSP
jgi:hypothetical protein